jgi:hypothetical protein
MSFYSTPEPVSSGLSEVVLMVPAPKTQMASEGPGLNSNEFLKVVVVTNYIFEKVMAETPKETEQVPAESPLALSPLEEFKNVLTPHGRWLETSFGNCWQPFVITNTAEWRPYLHGGKWTFSDKGMFWQSDYSWGSVAYHYGNWARDPKAGWVWIPGTQWAPNWVAWRISPRYLGWSPLPPGKYSKNKQAQASMENEFCFIAFESVYTDLLVKHSIFGPSGRQISAQSYPASRQMIFENSRLRYQWVLHERSSHRKAVKSVSEAQPREPVEKSAQDINTRRAVTQNIPQVPYYHPEVWFQGSGPTQVANQVETKPVESKLRPSAHQVRMTLGTPTGGHSFLVAHPAALEKRTQKTWRDKVAEAQLAQSNP